MKPKFRSISRYTAAMPVVMTLVLGGFAHAGTTWDGGGTTANWGDADNWDDNLTPPTGTGVSLTFAGTTGLTSNNNYTAWDDFGSLIFSSGAGAFTLTGNSIDLYGKIENNSTSLQTISLSDIGTGSVTGGFIEMNPVSGDLSVTSSNIYLGNNQLRVWGNNGKTLTFGAGTVISGASGTFSLNQNSNVIFQSGHTYTGDTFINAGRLELASGASLTTSQIQLGDTTGTAAAELRLTQAAGGFTSDRGITVRSGSSGTKTISATNSSGTNTLTGAVTLNNNLTLDQSSTGTLALGGIISGTGFGLTKTGTGTVSLSNASNSYTGGTSVNAGTLQVGNTSATNGRVTLNGGNLLITSGVNYYIDSGLTFASNTNATVAAASGTASMYGWDVNSADIVVNNGVSASIASSVSLGTGTYGLRIDNTGNLGIAGVISGSGTVGALLNSGAMVGSDVIGLFKKNAGELTLTGESTFSGSTSMQQGSLILSSGNNRLPATGAVYLGSTTNTNAKLVLDGISQTVTGLQSVGAGTLAVVGNSATASTLTVNNTNNYTFAGKIGGTGTNENNLALTKDGAGTLSLTGDNSYSGATAVNVGTLNIQHSNALGSVSGDTTVAAGATLAMQGGISVGNEALGLSGDGVSSGGALRNISGNNTYGGEITLNANTRINSDAGTMTLDGAIIHGTGHNLAVGGSGNTVINGFITITSGSLTKDGSGTLTLTQAGAFVGDTTISGGTLALSGSGSIASSNIINNGNFNVSAVTGGPYALGTTQTLSGTGTVTGDISIAGTLSIGSSPGTMTFEDDLGLDASSISNFEINGFGLGTFDLAQAAAANTQAVTFGGTLNLLFASGFNTNGSVKIFDFDSYAGNFTAVNTSGLASGYTASFDSTTGIVSVVPEASTTLLFGLGTLGLALRRRRVS